MSLITILLIIALASLAHHVAVKNDKDNLYTVIILSVIVFLFEPLTRTLLEIKTDDAIVPRILATISSIYYFYWAISQGKKEKLALPKGHMFWIIFGVSLFAFVMLTALAPRLLSNKTAEPQTSSTCTPENPFNCNWTTEVNEKPTLAVKSEDYGQKMFNLYYQQYPSLPDHTMYCLPKKKSYCSSEGCKDIPPTVFNIIGKNSNSLFIGRCDNKPCDIYEARPVEGVGYTSIETIEPHGMTFKISKQDASYTETVTLGTDAFVSTGSCFFTKN